MTEAKVGSNTTIDADGNVTIEAINNEDIKSFSVAAGGGSNVGITVSADVFILDLTTRAKIGSSADVFFADGSVLVQTQDETELDLIVGGVAIGGSAGIGASAGVAVVDKVNEALIETGADVTGKGNDTVSARTGRYDVSFAGSAAIAGYDPEGTSSPTAPPKPTKGDLEAGAPSGLSQFSDLDQDGTDGDADVDPGLTQERVATATVNNSFRGVAVSATSKDDVETFAISVGGGGSVGVAIGAAVNVIDVKTKAEIQTDAMINKDLTGNANGGQSVLVAAASDFNHVGVGAGAAFAGSGAAAPGVDVSVVTLSTKAIIGTGADVQAEDDVEVIATAKEKILIVSAGLAFSGTFSLAGGVSVLSLDAQTQAQIFGSADVDAGGDVAVLASDDTQFTVVSGAVGIGISGAGAAGSVGVVTITKRTEASIGDAAEVDALGNGTGISGVLDGTINGAGDGFDKKGAPVNGVIVQAEASEAATHISVAGGIGLYAGIAGGVTVTIIDSDTTAAIGLGAEINNDAANYLTSNGVNGNQGVYVNASNKVGVTSFAGALGVGFVGLAGAVDFGRITNDTVAAINAGAIVKAAGDVEVGSVSIKNLTGFTFSGAGGVVGLGASVSVWSIGENFSDGYDDKSGGSGNALQGDSGDASTEAGNQADDGVSGLGSELGGFESDANANTANSRLASKLGDASNRLSTDSLSGADLSLMLSASVPAERGTSASIGNGDVNAGNNIIVMAEEKMTVDLVLGNAAVGLVGAGASVSVLNLSGQVRAKADGKLKAGNTLTVKAMFNQDVDVTSVALQGGFVGLGASVVVVNDTSAVRAQILDHAVIDSANTINVLANSTQDFDLTTTGVQVGAAAVGASFTQLTIGDDDANTKEVEASIGINADIGKTVVVGDINIEARSTIDADLDTFAMAGGAIAGTFNFAVLEIHTDTKAAIGDNSEIFSDGLINIEKPHEPQCLRRCVRPVGGPRGGRNKLRIG
ncbi:hypothetical protein QW131_17585 [Roseibium salinum]|nr:hypothetical protein [Roseibium salinum]